MKMHMCNMACQFYLQLTVIFGLVLIPIFLKIIRSYWNGMRSKFSIGGGLSNNLSSIRKFSIWSNNSPKSVAYNGCSANSSVGHGGWPSSPPRPGYQYSGINRPTPLSACEVQMGIPRSRSPIAAYDQI